MKRLAVVAIFLTLLVSVAYADSLITITFDGLTVGPDPNSDYPLTSYDGVLWGQATGYQQHTGFWQAGNDPSYSHPSSGPNYVYNAYGPDSLPFTFTAPVTFTGAFFAGTSAGSAAEVRLVDASSGNPAQYRYSNWLTLAAGLAPTQLTVNWGDVTTVMVQRLPNGDQGGSWYSMDDVMYYSDPSIGKQPGPGGDGGGGGGASPELPSGALALLSMVPVGLTWWRRRKAA